MKPLLILAACAGLAACATPTDGPESATFGQAVASMDVQIVHRPVSSLPPEDSGARGTLAAQRLEKDKVKEPSAPETSDIRMTVVPYGGEK